MPIAGYCVDFDDSIDTGIRKDYKVENDELPPLPSYVPTAQEEYAPAPALPKYTPTGKKYILKSGTKVSLTLVNSISDASPRGTAVKFSSLKNITTKDGTTIPAGTIFKGRITNSHKPQLSGNGGLIELCIDEIYFNGIKSNIETKVSLAKSKKIYFNNIKGKRCYWHNCAKALKPGKKVFNATHEAARAMYPVPIVNILSIVPLACGTAVYTVNFVLSPVIAIFTKGGRISLPKGSKFEIKIVSDNEING